MLNLILKKDRGDVSCIDITKLPIFAKCEDVYCGSVILINGVTYIICSVIEKIWNRIYRANQIKSRGNTTI